MSEVSVIQKLVGEPRSHWIGNQWIPAEGSRLYTTDEIRQIFQQECTLFVGDSLQRRAADTLHLMLTTNTNSSHTPDVQDKVFTDEYFSQKKHDRGFRQRNIQPPSAVDGAVGTRRTGCIDTDWRPLFENVNTFADDFSNQTDVYGNYTVLVIGTTIWDVC